MARRNSVPASASEPCRLGDCGNMVKLNNPTYPYCRHHQSVKTLRSSFRLMTLSEQRRLFKAPKFSLLPRRESMAENISYSLGPSVSKKLTLPTITTWGNQTRGLDMSDPDTCLDNRGRLIEIVGNDVSDIKGIDVDILNCEDGYTMNSDGAVIHLNDHQVLLAHDKQNDNNIVIDVACAAPLSGTPGLGNIESGISTLQDGLMISHMFEYSSYSSPEYSQIVSPKTGEVYFQNNVNTSDTTEAREQREIIEQFGHPNRNVDMSKFSGFYTIKGERSEMRRQQIIGQEGIMTGSSVDDIFAREMESEQRLRERLVKGEVNGQ